jgi:hypothetical protein
MVFQEIGVIRHLDLEAEMIWSHPLVHDLVHFQPGPPPGKTPGAFMESKPGVCLYPAIHRSVADENDIGKKPADASPWIPGRYWLSVAGRKPVAIVTRVIYNGNESLT